MPVVLEVVMSDILAVFSRFNWLSAVDVLFVTLIFYGVIRLLQGTRAIALLRGLILVLLVMVVLANFTELTALKWLLNQLIPAFLISIPIIFQPELRQALEKLGRTAPILGRPTERTVEAQVVEAIVQAATSLAEKRHGAIIVLEGEVGLQPYVDAGVAMDAKVSAPVLMSIFYPNAPLHDGAVIVRENRIVAASCVLPLTDRHLDIQMGTRHRAAIGITEVSDALAVVVSEETGSVSVARNGRMVRGLDDHSLREVLHNFYHPRAPFRKNNHREENQGRVVAASEGKVGPQ